MASLGEELRRERQMREISLREISNATKISIRMLEGIENNDYSLLPGGVFNRNFLRAYAEFVGLDAEDVVRKYELMMSQLPSEEIRLQGLLTEKIRQPKRDDTERRRRILIAVVALILILTVAGITLFWKPGFYWRITAESPADSSSFGQ